MTVRFNIRCKICENNIIVKVQAGYIDNSPVAISCPHCNASIKGEIVQNPPLLNLILENCDRLSSDTEMGLDIPIIQLSPELPIPKESYVTFGNYMTLNPYMAVSPIVGFENISYYISNYKFFLDSYEERLDDIENVINLFVNDKHEILISFFQKKFPEISNNIKKDISGSYNTSVYIIISIIQTLSNYILPKGYNQNIRTDILFKETISSLKKRKNSYKKALEETSTILDLKRDFLLSCKSILRFYKNIREFAPVILLSSKSLLSEFDDEFKITTFSFVEQQSAYQDNFELIVRLIPLAIALNNQKYRDDINQFIEPKRDKNFHEFSQKRTMEQSHTLAKYPILNKYFTAQLNNQIRNSIGHHKTKYDGITQEITYYPNVKSNDEKKISLIDFSHKLLITYYTIIDLNIMLGKFITVR